MSHLTPSLTTRRTGAAILIGLALLLVSVFVFQPASAQRQPARLKPPFKLIGVDTAPQPLGGLPPLPLNAPVIVSETFDSTYVNRSNYDVSDLSKPWHEVNSNGTATTGYTWGYVPGLSITDTVLPITDTVWGTKTNPPGKDPIAAGSPYTTNQDSLLIYGPVNLSDYSAAIISATYYLDVQDGDYFGVAYSTDGTNFQAVSAENGRDPGLSTKRVSYWRLPPDAARKNGIWLAFYFNSGDHPIDALGVYINDVVIRAQPLYKIYMPLIRFDTTPTPTPTATPTITPTPQTAIDNYDFGAGSSSNAQFIEWGGGYTYSSCSSGTDCDVIQSASTNGNPSGAINYSAGEKNAIIGTSPNHTIPANFDLSADFMLVEGKQDGRFGLVFGASSSTFYNDGGVIKMNGVYNYYKVDLNIDPNDETLVDGVRLQRWSGGLATNLVNQIILPAQYQRSKGQWGNLRVVVQNSYITVYVNGYPVIVNRYDATYTTTARKYGVFLHPQASNNNANPFKIRFDNVIVRQVP